MAPFLAVSLAFYIMLLIRVVQDDLSDATEYIITLSMFTWIALTSMLTFSIWRIRKFSAMLAQN